jgi:GrpB-like predicted nucleotidyltransferase (UPF0157 family)
MTFNFNNQTLNLHSEFIMVRKVEVVPHDPEWKKIYESESIFLKSIFKKEIITIHHIGSTVIPNISAKPIIDIIIEVKDINKVDKYNKKMIEQGYIPKGEAGITKRRFFIKGSEEFRISHVYVFQKGDFEIIRHLKFRDYMIAHPKEAQEYSQLKEHLAREYPEDIDGYIEGKDAFIKSIDKKAKTWK